MTCQGACEMRQRRIARRALVWGVWLATLCAPSHARAGVWVVTDYFPNVAMAALGYTPAEIRDDGGPAARTRYHLYSWSHTTGTGIFYQSVDEPTGGVPCPGVPDGVHAGYGRPGAGYDWYAVDAAGFHYLGWMYFFPDAVDGHEVCDRAVGVVAEPYQALAYPRVIDDSALPEPRTFALTSRQTIYRGVGENQLVVEESPAATITYQLDVLQPGGPGTMLGLRISDPATGWWMVDWLSGPRSCAAFRCWPDALKKNESDHRGIWQVDSGDASGAEHTYYADGWRQQSAGHKTQTPSP